jgi:hypothetical protein
LSAASLQSPGSIEEHRASRLRRDKRHGAPFFGSVSLGKQRNEQKERRMKKNYLAAGIIWQADRTGKSSFFP